MRLPAPGLEAIVRSRIGTLLADPAGLSEIIPSDLDQAAIIAVAARRASEWSSLPASAFGAALADFVSRICVLADRIEIAILPDRFAAWIAGTQPATSVIDPIVIAAPVRVQQRGQEMRLVFACDTEKPASHEALVRLLSRAHNVRRRLIEERQTIDEVAKAEDLIPSYVTRLIRLTFLAPDIQAAIPAGRHDPDLTVTSLMADTRFALSWDEQRRRFASA